MGQGMLPLQERYAMESKYWPKKLKSPEGSIFYLRSDGAYHEDSRLPHAGVQNYNGPLGRSSDFESEIGTAASPKQG